MIQWRPHQLYLRFPGSAVRSRSCLFAPSGYWARDCHALEAKWDAEGYRPERRPVVLYAGRVIPRINTLDLVEAFAIVSRDFPEWTLDIHGLVVDPAYGDRVCERVASLGLEGRVRFLDAVYGEALYRLYREAEIFSLPSDGEGFPSAIIEAMFFGSAIVAGDSGYIREQIDYGRCGLLHLPGDVPQLAAHLKALMSSPALRADLRKKARERMLQVYTWENYFPKIEEKFRRVLRAHEADLEGNDR